MTYESLRNAPRANFDALGRVMFNDPADMLAVQAYGMRDDSAWTGETIAETLQRTATGDLSRVPEAEKIVDKIAVEIEASAVEWVHDVAGAYPDVAAFLANDPENMKRRRHVELSEKAPVRVFICTTSSQSVSAANLARRGVAALALAMALIRQGRAVELIAFAVTHGEENAAGDRVTIVATKMRTTPVDLASVAYCMTSGGFNRTIPYGIAKTNGFNGQWPSGKGAAGIRSNVIAEREAACRRLLGDWITPDDVLLANVFSGDETLEGSPLKDPVAWVQSTLARFIAGEGRGE